jgi:hypothetical protein
MPHDLPGGFPPHRPGRSRCRERPNRHARFRHPLPGVWLVACRSPEATATLPLSLVPKVSGHLDCSAHATSSPSPKSVENKIIPRTGPHMERPRELTGVDARLVELLVTRQTSEHDKTIERDVAITACFCTLRQRHTKCSG